MSFTPYQLPLMGDDSQAGRVMHVAGLVPSVKAAMQRALAAVTPPLSREQLVDRMNEIAKQAGAKMTPDKSRLLTLPTLEKWLCPNDTEHVPSLVALEVFMLAVDGRAPLDVLASLHGYRLISPEQVKILEYGQAKLSAKRAGRAMRRLEEEIGHV